MSMNEPTTSAEYKDYGFHDCAPSHMHRYFLPPIFELCGKVCAGMRVLDVGCGNGHTVGEFLRRGCRVVGVDLSESGIKLARETYPAARFEIQKADTNLLSRLSEEPFDFIVSTEVVEHLYAPRAFAQGCFAALKPGGRFICTTPYHGYLKNLLIALMGKWDSHANPLWDGGHIKLWSRHTLTRLFVETGFTNIRFRGAGRLPWLWMTMVMSGDKPEG